MSFANLAKRLHQAALIVGLIGGLPAASALAHAHLAKATPAADAMEAVAPTKLLLEFNEAIEPKFSGVTVTDPDKAVVKLGAAAAQAGNAAILIIPIAEPLKAGKYTVDWHALSADGHKVKGSYSFTVK